MRPELLRIPLPDWLPIDALPIRGYGAMLALGFLAAILVAAWRARRENENPDHIYNIAIIALLGGVIGARLFDVIEYADIPSRKGPLFMDSPSYDAPSVTGIVAGGAQVVVFTTGLGTPFGMSIVPVVKVMSNTPAFRRMEDTADLNAGTILDGEETIREAGERLYRLVLDVANGRTTKAEELGENQCQIWRTTLTL